MVILAIETSCDDTCVAVLKVEKKHRQNNSLLLPNFKVLVNIVSSQEKIHKKYGGVYPMMAKREHEKNLPIILKKALSKIKNQSLKIDLIAVCNGPGLEPCLWTGINFAKNLAQRWKIPIVKVNHIESHILINFIKNSKLHLNNPKLFPAICLVVSGGHTQLILMKKLKDYKILGETRDDAAGECFDKIARILGLDYPGGPIINKLATEWKKEKGVSKFKINLPRPMINQKNYDFSFSGLKTAVLYKVKSIKPEKLKKMDFIKEMAFNSQQAIIDVLVKKTIKAAKDQKAKTIILAGGVAANKELRRQLFKNCKLKIKDFNFFVPEPKLCTDNALMTAIAGYFNLKKKTKNLEKIKAEANLKIK